MFRAQNRAQKADASLRLSELSRHGEATGPQIPQPRSQAEAAAPYRLVMRSLSELHPHTSWVKHNLGLSMARLSAIDASWDTLQLDPISIAGDGTILKGHEVCELARRRGLEKVPCLEYDLDEAEALLWIIQRSHRDQELNLYHRIILALDYEPSFLMPDNWQVFARARRW